MKKSTRAMKPTLKSHFERGPRAHHGDPRAGRIAAILLMGAAGAMADNLLLDNFNGAGNPNPGEPN